MYRDNEKRTGIYQTKGIRNLNSWQNSSLPQPPHSDISMFKTEEKISFIIPHNKGEPGDLNNCLILFYISLFIAALICSPISTSGELSFVNQMIIRIVLAIPLGSAMLYFLFSYLFSTFGYTQLDIDKDELCLIYSLFGFQRKIFIKTKNITEVDTTYDLIASTRSRIPLVITKCLIVEGTKYRKFSRYIKRVEKEWLIEEINSFLAQLSDR